jgi:hypothetical protein
MSTLPNHIMVYGIPTISHKPIIVGTIFPNEPWDYVAFPYTAGQICDICRECFPAGWYDYEAQLLFLGVMS